MVENHYEIMKLQNYKITKSLQQFFIILTRNNLNINFISLRKTFL